MDNRYIEENQEALEKLIATMSVAFKNNNIVNKPAPIDTSEVVVVKKREKLRRFGVNVTNEGEQYILKNVLSFADYLVAKYKLDKFESEKIATDIMGYHILKIVYQNAGLEFSSNYARYAKKREAYTLYKGIVFIIVALLIGLFFILK